MLRATVAFAAGVVVGAVGRDALPKLQEHFPKLKENLAPVVAAAVAGARDAAGDAFSHVARNVAETVETVQDAVAKSRESHADAADGVSPVA